MASYWEHVAKEQQKKKKSLCQGELQDLLNIAKVIYNLDIC